MTLFKKETKHWQKKGKQVDMGGTAMNSIDISGKTVDEAIFKGLDQMGLSIDEVDIEVIEEGGRRFFGSKPYIVRLTKREKPITVDLVEESQSRKSSSKTGERKRRVSVIAVKRQTTRDWGKPV